MCFCVKKKDCVMFGPFLLHQQNLVPLRLNAFEFLMNSSAIWFSTDVPYWQLTALLNLDKLSQTGLNLYMVLPFVVTATHFDSA